MGFLCDICGRGFKTKDLCSSHRLSHGDRKLTCSECGAKFKQRNVLHQHKTVKHGLKKYVCKIHFKRMHHFKKHLTTLSHIDKVAEMKSKGEITPMHLDPSLVLGQDVDELAKQSCCDICPKNVNQNVTKFKSTYHFFKHIRSKGHIERIVQLIQIGQSIASHLLPPNLTVDENSSTTDVFVLDNL